MAYSTQYKEVKYIHDILLEMNKNYDIECKTFTTTYVENIEIYEKRLEWVDLYNIKFIGCDFRDLTFYKVSLNSCEFIDCDLSEAMFKGTSFDNVRFSISNLTNAIFIEMDSVKNLEICDMCNITGITFKDVEKYSTGLKFDMSNVGVDSLPMACPSEGEFIAYKKAYVYDREIYEQCRSYEWKMSSKLPLSLLNGMKKPDICIVKFLIPVDAKRSSAFSNKCRCNKAKVLEILYLDEKDMGVNKAFSMTSIYDPIIYEIGETVSVDDFDENRFNECSTGIHFFMTFDEACEY